MELKNEVIVNSPIEEVWEAFNDVERVAPCLLTALANGISSSTP